MKAFIAIALISLSIGAEPTKNEPLTWQKILAWLPADTETLVVAQGAFPVGTDDKNPAFAQWLTAFASGQHRHPNLVKHWAKMEKAEIRLVVEGARNFRGPDGPGNIGEFRYEGCHFIVFTEASTAPVSDWYAALKADAQTTFQLHGQEVLYFMQLNQGSVGDTFLVRPRPALLLIATNKSYLEEVLRRMKQPDKKGALPAESIVWKHVDTKSLVWAVRQPSSVIDKHKSDRPTNDWERTLMLMPGKEHLCRLRIIAKDPPPPELFASDKNGETTPRPFRQVTPGVCELTLDLKDQESLLILQIAFWLGHGVVI